MANQIKIRRGNIVDLPALESGEFGWAQDAELLYIGNPDGYSGTNVLINPIRRSSDESFVFDGYLNPSRDNTYGLGTEDFRWSSVSVGPGSLHLVSKASDPAGSKRWSVNIDDTGRLVLFDEADVTTIPLTLSTSQARLGIPLVFSSGTELSSPSNGSFVLTADDSRTLSLQPGLINTTADSLSLKVKSLPGLTATNPSTNTVELDAYGNFRVDGYSLFVYSSTERSVDPNQYLILSHNASDGYISSGKGDILLGTSLNVGGNTVHGNSVENGNLVLSSTTHPVKGRIYFGSAQDAYYNELSAQLNIDGYVVIGPDSINNLEPSPNAVTFNSRFYHNAPGAFSESAALYMRVSPAATNDVTNGIYIETSDTNSQQSTGIKIIHKGLNDGVYIAGFNNSAALETASFKNGTTGFISTCQWEAPDTGARDFGNSTLFNAVWGDDGTGGSTTPANFGMYYASLSLGHSVRTRLQSSAATGWAWGRVEWAISSYDLGRNHFDIYNLGQLNVRSRSATAGLPVANDAHLRVSNAYWTGAASADKSVKFTVDSTGGLGDFIVSQGTESSEVETLRVSTSGNLTIQGNFIDTGADSLSLFANSVRGFTVSNSSLDTIELDAYGDLTVAGKIDPDVDNAYGLGSASARWKDGYFYEIKTQGFAANIDTIVFADSPYFANSRDYTILADATGGAITIYLYSSSADNAGRIIHVKKIDASGNNITITASGVELIDGSNTNTVSGQYTTRSIQADGLGNWWVL